MTQVTPAGWYPDPGQKQDGPPTERWWDGTAWTARIRPTAPAPGAATPEGGGGSDAGAPGGRVEEAPGQGPGGDAPAEGTPAGRTAAGGADAGHAGATKPAGTEHTAGGQAGASPAGPEQDATPRAGTGVGTAAGNQAEGRAAGAQKAASGQAAPGQVDAAENAGHVGAAQAAGGHADVTQRPAGQADAGPGPEGGADRGQAARGRAAAGQAGEAQAVEGQIGAVQEDVSPAGPASSAGDWVAVGPAAAGPIPGHGGPGATQGGAWGPVETLGGGHPAYPVHPSPPPSPRGRRLRIGIAVAVAAAVLASIGVGVYALTDDDGGRSTATSQQRGGQDDGRGAPEDGAPDREGDGGGDGGDDSRRVESGSVTDSLSGISLPVPDGWYGEELQVGASLTSKESYDCPGDTSKSCVKGGVYSAPALVLGTRGDTAEEVAKADISANAEESYGGEAYGRITSHDVLASKAVTVAGQKGYLVRWKAVTQEGSDGFVQSLAFPSPSRPDQIVVVRFGVDVDQQQKILDEITEGIEVAKSGRGNGQDV